MFNSVFYHVIFNCVLHIIYFFISAVCYAIALGVFEDSDPDFAGFFSLNGRPSSGCIDISYGLAIGSIAINIIGVIVATLAFCYKPISNIWNHDKD